jgi:beta-galactosidase
LLDDGWRFIVADPTNGAAADFDDAAWRAVTLPHDWSIEGKRYPTAPMGGDGGFFPSGVGWYRRHLDVPVGWADRRVEVEFEGVYCNADVYLNGRKLAFHPYGFTSFFVDLTAALRCGEDNVLAVRVDNSHQKNNQAYTGSGIYRHVWLTVMNPVHVAPWGVFVSVPKADAESAQVTVQTEALNESSTPENVTIQTELFAPDGRSVGRAETKCDLLASGTNQIEQYFNLRNPALWFPETPRMSRARTRVVADGKILDEVSTPFGVRSLAWSAEKGLLINGRTVKLSGGCIHPDNGVLGMCAFDRAEERKIELLKAAGFNAIRTTHNPPSPALLAACDRLGMMVLEEAFDAWAVGKYGYKFDYSMWFKDWWERDVESMVRRDRNHPSVVMWSTGNETPGVFDAMGAEYGPKLANRFRQLDPTRPVTQGIVDWPPESNDTSPGAGQKVKNAETNWNALDIVGSNYTLDQHIARHDKFPNRILVSTESMPPLGMANEVADNAYVVGDFIWTGQDYFGESGLGRWYYEGERAVPYPRNDGGPGQIDDRVYPEHGANSGVVDLLGRAKPAGHWRNMVWNMGETLYLAVRQPEDGKRIIVTSWGCFPDWESWTWPGHEGKPMEVEVYSRHPGARLYLNGKLVGEQPTTRGGDFRAMFNLNYEPGVLKAVGVRAGKEVQDCRLETVGEPAAIRLTPDRRIIHAGGQDLSFVTVEVVDSKGRRQPNADQDIQFELTGPGFIAGLGNANLKTEEPYRGNQFRLFHGRALIVLRSAKQTGTLVLRAHSPTLVSAVTKIKSK